MKVTFHLDKATLKDLASLEELLTDSTPLMKRLGALMVSESQRAFTRQRFGDEQWDARYPTQENPKINIAGALMDWKSGRKAPKPNRFQDRPALIDEGMRGGLQGSITFRVNGPHEFDVGTSKPYASLHQFGGVTSIGYDKPTRLRIREWLYGSYEKQVSKDPRKKRIGTAGTRINEYEKHIRPLLFSSTWRQRVIRRPFIGIHPQLAEDMIKAIVEYLKERFNR